MSKRTKNKNRGCVSLLISGILSILLLLQSSPAQAAPPTWQASSSIAASTGADVTVTLPTHAAGDILLLQVVVRDTNDTITWPAGWTQIATVDRGTTARYWWAWKRAASPAELNPLVDKSTTTGDTYAAVTTYRGALGSNPWDIIGTPNTATTTAHTLNGITTTTADTLIIASLCGEDNTAATGTTFSATSPASLTQVLYGESNAGADGACTAGAAAKAASGATGNATATWTATVVGSGGIVLALKPAVATQLAFAQQPTNATAGATITPAVTVQIQDSDGNLVTTATNTVSLAIGSNPGSGTLGGTTSVAAVAGVATFNNLSINNAGAGYTLTASAAGLTGATSGSFNITAPVTLTTSAVKDLTCAGYRDGSNLNCTAGEFTIGATFSAAPGTPPMCVAGQPFNFKVDLRLYGSNADRYDIGFFSGQQGNDPALTTAGNICSVATFPETPSPWLDIDAPTQPTDTCGDYLGGGDSTITVDEIKVVCAGDSTGALMVPYVLTYWQNTGNICTGPSDIQSGSTSKCNKGTSTVSGAVSVFSGAYIDVTKQTSPDGDSQAFSFAATGPAGSKVIALTGATLTPTTATGGTYTPETIATATNTTTVTLADGQTARFYINALPTNQTLTITETAVANWESTAAISCSTVAGSPALTTDNANRTMSAALNSTDNAATCTITNTKRSRITLTKSIAGRLDPADQFTVSASDGGTLTGTTSATTSGAGTSASTTLYSTPNTALTLTDAKASGPNPLSSYETLLTCTNAYTGPGATPDTSLPNALYTASTSITPAPGDDITCTFTNSPKATLTKAFSAGTINIGQAATLTFTISNPAGAPARTGGLTFTDTFPANLVIAGTPNAVNNCGGSPTITATAGSGLFTVGGTGVNAAAGSSTCTTSVDVTSNIASSYINGSGQITSISSSLINGVTNQTLNVVQPSITVIKSVITYSDPVNDTTSPKAIPGSVMTYSVQAINSGLGAADNNSVVITDPIPANTELFAGDINGAGSGPVLFTDGTPVSGLSYSFINLSSGADSVSFSNDGGTTWTYTPVPDANNCDANVTNIKISLTGPFDASDGTNNPSFELKFRVRVK